MDTDTMKIIIYIRCLNVTEYVQKKKRRIHPLYQSPQIPPARGLYSMVLGCGPLLDFVQSPDLVLDFHYVCQVLKLPFDVLPPVGPIYFDQ